MRSGPELKVEMIAKSTVPREFSADLGYLQAQDVSRIMSSVVALGAEVFMLKAELKRLQLALAESGVATESSLQRTGESAEFNAWLASEQATFARNLLDPIATTPAAQ